MLDPNRHDQKRNEALVWVHPGIYRTDSGKLRVFISNFSDVDAVMPSGKFVGYLRQITKESPSCDTINSLPTERRFDKLTESDRTDWEQFIVTELGINDNELLQANPCQRKKVIDAFMHNLAAVAQHSHDYGDTDLLQFHLQIKPGSKPVRDKCRPLNPIQAKDFERQLKEWTSQGVVEPSLSEYASALVLVVKKATSHLRWCVDYRKLNEIMVPDQYPLPNISVNLNKLAGSRIYSCLDSCGAYHSIKIEPESRRYTAFTSPLGLYQFVKLPFGLRNAGQCYNRLVQIALGSLGVQAYALAYLDDIIIHSTSLDEHVIHLTKILELHARFGLKLNLNKCQICKQKVTYLGHMLLCRKFILRTDASALKHLSSLKENRGIFSRWLLYLADFEFDVIHRASTTHVTADALSRRTDIKDETLYSAQDLLVSISTGNINKYAPLLQAMTTKRIAEASSQDPVLKQVMEFVAEKRKPTTQEQRSLPVDVKHYLNFFECLQLDNGVLYFQAPTLNGHQPERRICIPQMLQKQVFLAGHSADYAGHMGENRTYDVLKTRCYFPNMYSFICVQIKNCVTCITKATTARKPTHRMYKQMVGSFNQYLFVDTVGLFTPACMHHNKKCSDFITIQDGYTRFLVAAPVKDLTAMTLAQAIIENWIHVFSVPQRIHSDNGPAFTSSLMNEIMRQYHIKRTFTPPYSPEANRVERAHRVIGQLIRTDRRSPVDGNLELRA